MWSNYAFVARSTLSLPLSGNFLVVFSECVESTSLKGRKNNRMDGGGQIREFALKTSSPMRTIFSVFLRMYVEYVVRST